MINNFTKSLRPIKLILMGCLLQLSLNTSFAGDKFYKWTDENGNVHYSNTKPDDQYTSEINVKSTDPIPQILENDLEESPNHNIKTTKQKLDDFSKKNKDSKKLAAENLKKCKAARKYLEKYSKQERFSRVDPKSGKKIYLDDVKRAQFIRDSKTSIRKYCK